MSMRAIVTFKEPGGAGDGMGGGYSRDYVPIVGLERIKGEFKPERGRERLESGRLESTVAGTLRVRSSAAARSVRAGNIVTMHEIEGDEDYNIHAVINPDQRNRYLEFTIERGGALK